MLGPSALSHTVLCLTFLLESLIIGTPWRRMLGIWLWLAGFEVETDAADEFAILEPSML
jgi:hypothetical protein